MEPTALFGLIGIIGFGSGLVAAVASRRPGVTRVVGLVVVCSLYLLYVLTVGEGAPFVPAVMVWGAAGGSVVVAGFLLGVGAARFVDRSRVP
jgi:hypothetical protein